MVSELVVNIDVRTTELWVELEATDELVGSSCEEREEEMVEVETSTREGDGVGIGELEGCMLVV